MIGWRLGEWNSSYSRNNPLPPITKEEIEEAIAYLRDNSYPKPIDCPETQCPKYRPACKLNTCHIAVGMCGDY